MKDFLIKNRVFILGLIGAITISIENFVNLPEPDLKAVGLAIGLAALSFIANQWKGKGFTVLGIIGIFAGILAVQLNGGTISWIHVILSTLVGVGNALAALPAQGESLKEGA